MDAVLSSPARLASIAVLAIVATCALAGDVIWIGDPEDPTTTTKPGRVLGYTR